MVEHVFERRLSGGIRIPAHKEASTRAPIARGLKPKTVVLPLTHHRGPAAEPAVAVGDHVRKGQIVGRASSAQSAAVHASIAGRVAAVEMRPVPGGDGVRDALCVVVTADPDVAAASADKLPAWPADRASQLEHVRLGGLVGLGGAAFPTAEKLEGTVPCRALIVNGAECEPYISCDDVLMRECAGEIVAGALTMTELLGAPLCIIAIERDKPEAIAAIRNAAQRASDARLRLAEVPTIYPAGGERQLVEVLTGEEVPSGTYPSDVGYLVQNVGTAFALRRVAAAREPLTSRIVTVTGRGVRDPQNVDVPIGTPIADVVAACGGYVEPVERLVCGGSMMGYALPSDELPVTKAVNCIIAATADEIRVDRSEWPCIRCAECAMACPARLEPQELLIAAQTSDFDALSALGLYDCIECGCCDVVCPSQIVLTERFRGAKRALAAHERRSALAAAADERFRRREERLAAVQAREEAQREKLRKTASDDDARRAAIAAALERTRQRRERPGDGHGGSD